MGPFDSRKIRNRTKRPGASQPSLLTTVANAVSHWQDSALALERAVAKRAGTNLTDQRCLQLLFQRGAMGAGQLAKATGLSPAAFTTVMDRLERAGYARRARDVGDRRRVVVQLTPKAEHLIKEVFEPLATDAAGLLHGYRPQELKLVLRFLEMDGALQSRHARRIAGPGGGAGRGRRS